MPNQKNNQNPVIVKKVVEYRNKRSFTDFLIGTIILLLLIVLIGGMLSVTAWLYTYNALTAEKIVGELTVSGRIIKDGVPVTRVTYRNLDREPAASFLSSSQESFDITRELKGDQVFVDANFIRWENWVTLLGVRPVYKVYRIKSDFINLEDRNRFKTSAFDVNGGPDNFIIDLEKSQSNYRWAIQSTFISSAGINISNETQVFNIVVTNDAIVLEKSN
jgi:hypothetical protein